jgi:hypothetical protein
MSETVACTPEAVGALIAKRLTEREPELRRQWRDASPLPHVVVDDFLPEELAAAASLDFPPPEKLFPVSSIRERKKGSGTVEDWGPATRAIMLGFQRPEVLEVLTRLSGIERLVADPAMWGSGVSRMDAGDFLNPHIDHVGHPSLAGHYRRLNLLYYVSCNLAGDGGGELELWSPDMKERRSIPAAFNRLVLMLTNRSSLHSVAPIRGPGARLCLSNYYFTRESPEGRDYFHITSFRGRPGQWLRDVVLRAEAAVGAFVLGRRRHD